MSLHQSALSSLDLAIRSVRRQFSRPEVENSAKVITNRPQWPDRRVEPPGVPQSRASLDSTIDPYGLTNQAFRELVSAGLNPAAARSIAQATLRAWRGMSSAQRGAGIPSFRRVLAECIVGRLRFAPALQPSKESRSILIFAGPPGAGKTTALAKIAMREFLDRRIPVRIISVDPHHTVGHEKMRSLARIIGAQFEAANTMAEFSAAVSRFSGRGGLLIDAAGYDAAESQSARELAWMLRGLGPKQTHLVLPAWMMKDDLIRLARQYQEFAADYLLFSHIDQTDSYGDFISAAIEIQKPLSFLASGPDIPEDLGSASPSVLFAALFHGRRLEAAWTTEIAAHLAGSQTGTNSAAADLACI
jgi:signal recognition particle GTPase